MKRPILIVALLAAPLLQACGSDRTELPPLPTPGPDMCIEYRTYRYSPKAAAYETKAALDAHNGNEAVFYEKCIAPKRSIKPEVHGDVVLDRVVKLRQPHPRSRDRSLTLAPLTAFNYLCN